MSAGKRKPLVAVTPAEVQKARSFLFAHHKRGFRIPARAFAAAARELGVGFRELLRFIARIYLGGQHESVMRRQAIDQLLRGVKS